MKRLRFPPESSVSRPAVSLYRDDVDLIVEEMKAVGYKVDFSDDEYSFDDLEELTKIRGATPSSIRIAGNSENSHAILQVRRWSLGGLVLDLRGEEKRNGRIRKVILDIVSRRGRWFVKLISLRLWGALAFLGAAGGMASIFMNRPRLAEPVLCAFAIGMVGVLLSFILQYGFGSRVHLVHRHATTNFFTRNWETIAVGVIGAILGSVVTLILQKVTAASAAEMTTKSQANQ